MEGSKKEKERILTQLAFILCVDWIRTHHTWASRIDEEGDWSCLTFLFFLFIFMLCAWNSVSKLT